MNLLRHTQTVQREEDGLIQFWRINNFLQNQFPHFFLFEQTMVNEVNMYLKIPGLPRFFVKHAHSTSVRQLIQKIENHPDRHAIQRDQRQRHQFYVRISQSFNCFSPESDKIIQDVGNIKLSELLETEPKTQCIVLLSF